eukprot:4228286-Lingulodinium_polyedra.AAC.1
MPMKLISVRKLTMWCKEKCHVVSYRLPSWGMSRLARNEGLRTEGDEAPLRSRNTGGIIGVGEEARMETVMECVFRRSGPANAVHPSTANAGVAAASSRARPRGAL